MKKIVTLLFACTLFSLGLINVQADTTSDTDRLFVINQTEQQARVQKLRDSGPDELVKLYDEQNFILSDEWFDENGDFIKIKAIDVKYVETSTYISSVDSRMNQQIQRELTAEEYKNWTPKETRASCADPEFGAIDCWETNAKRIWIIYQSYPQEMVMVYNTWKSIPSVKSYDTIGVLWDNFSMSSAWGYQYHDGVGIRYNQGSSNMKISTSGQQGVSISQDIDDSVSSSLQNELYVAGTEGTYMRMAASYQHAVKNISLATSQNFNFNPWGMGKVFGWNVSSSNWDNMQGVCFNWSPYLWTC